MLAMMMVVCTQAFKGVPSIGRKNSASQRVQSTSLNAWSLQRLGQPVGINVDVQNQPKVETPFGDSVTTGTGIDERKVRHGKTDSESDWKLISDIDGYFRKQSLLSTLESRSMSEPDKLQRIRMAADYEGLLPSEFSTVKAAALGSAGLMEDWNFESF